MIGGGQACPAKREIPPRISAVRPVPQRGRYLPDRIQASGPDKHACWSQLVSQRSYDTRGTGVACPLVRFCVLAWAMTPDGHAESSLSGTAVGATFL